MSRDKTFCWIHMESYCKACELQQLKEIIKDATEFAERREISPPNLFVDKILNILKRPIKPSTFEFEEEKEK